jgi:hypothetical protein
MVKVCSLKKCKAIGDNKERKEGFDLGDITYDKNNTTIQRKQALSFKNQNNVVIASKFKEIFLN